MLPVWRSGPLQEPVPEQTAGETTGPPGKRPGPAMVSAYQSPANRAPGFSHYTQVPDHLLRLLRGLRLVFESSQARRRGPDAGCFGRHIVQPPGSKAAESPRQSNVRPKGESCIPSRSDNCQRNKQPTLLQSAPRPITATVYSTIR
ncbi:hypothetical protein MTO96_024684 [Rhipicephalus appendiculatus]